MNDDTQPVTLADLKALFAEQNQHMNERFKQVDNRFDQITNKMNGRFKQVDERFEQLTQDIAEHVYEPLASLQEDVSQIKINLEELSANVERIDTKLNATIDRVDDHAVRLNKA